MLEEGENMCAKDSGCDNNEDNNDPIFNIFSFMQAAEDALGYLSPYAPTPEYLEQAIIKVVHKMLDANSRQPVVYEPGCGKAKMSIALSKSMKPYIVCLEIDKGLIEEAYKNIRSSGCDICIELVMGDLRSFRPRRANLVYAYLLPYPIMLLEKLLPKGTILLSLDYRGEKEPLYIVRLGNHNLYVISL